MSIIVTDSGFAPDDRVGEPVALDGWPGAGGTLDLTPETDLAALDAAMGAQRPAMVRIAFPSSADGRGFTLARHLRDSGYDGRLRAHGHVLADQYTMARRSGFDEVEIDEDLARRQPEAQWLARADWQAHDYRPRLGGRRPSPTAR